MTKVENRRLIRRLALRELKYSRKMNVVVILAIMLTCILFTTLVSIGGSLINGTQQETMRQVGGDRMAGLKCVLPEDYEKVRADKEVKDVVYRILVGDVVNEGMKNLTAEVNYAGSEEAAEAVFSYPETGRLPEAKNEIAVSTLLLDELDLPHELGITVPITLEVDGEISQHQFILCGYWQGEKLAMAQECWVSKDFADEYAPTPPASFYAQEYPGYAGYYMVDFNYGNSWDIESKTEELLARLYENGENVPEVGINWAYTTSVVDGGTLAGLLLLLLIIFAAGYLIIYNVFFINVSANIRGFGLLKTNGTTSKQIRRMVRIQAGVYSVIGIPFGLLVGIFLGRVLLKSVMATLDVFSAASYAVSAGLLAALCLLSALFTFATVMISCWKPCRVAGNISPIEALRYNETNIPVKKSSKKTGKVTPLAVARNNMARSRKKTFVVVLSLTLSMILVNTLVTVLNGFDMDKFVSNLIVGDFVVTYDQSGRLDMDRFYCISPEQAGQLEHIDGAEEVEMIYFEEGRLNLTGDSLKKLNALCEKYEDTDEYGLLEGVSSNDWISTDIYGISSGVLPQLEAEKGTLDAKEFESGKYAIVYTQYIGIGDPGNEEDDFYEVGDQLNVTAVDGETKSYTVMAVCQMPYALSTQQYSGVGGQIMIPVSQYFTLTKNRSAMTAMINAEDGRYDQVDEQIRAVTDRDDSEVVLKSKQTYVDQYEDFLNMIKLVGGSLSGIFALIGILNFVNAVMTGILSRKRELAMMNAVGMTGRQLKTMLMWEGIHYALLTAICALIAGTLVSYVVVNGVAENMYFIAYHFTFLPIGICVLILLLLSAVIPVVSYRTICRDSIVDRLREN